MVEIKRLEYHVADACNLSCEFCTHYSNFGGPSSLVGLNQAEHEWSGWATKIRPEIFSLIGGEPLLNPDIAQLVALANRTWTQSSIRLYTNGKLIHRHPELRSVMKGGEVVIGLHLSAVENEETERRVRQFFFATGVKVRVVDGTKHKGWYRFYELGPDGEMRPFNHGDQRASWENCVAGQQRCFVLRDSKLWKCPQIAFADRAGISDWFDGYDSCGLDDDIQSWAAREDEACCKNCPATKQFTRHDESTQQRRRAMPLVQIG